MNRRENRRENRRDQSHLNTLSLLAITLTALALAPLHAKEVTQGPGGPYPSLQAAVDDAGPNGTVILTAGDFVLDEILLLDVPVTIRGAGMGETRIDATATPIPDGFGPVIRAGGHPFAVFPLTSGYELSDFDLIGDPVRDNVEGIGAAWVEDLTIQDVRLTGFVNAVAIHYARDVVVAGSVVEGRGPLGFSRGIRFPLLSQSVLANGGFPSTDLDVHHNEISGTSRPIEIVNAEVADVHHNAITSSLRGIQAVAAVDLDIHHNHVDLSGAPAEGGILLYYSSDSTITLNDVCSVPFGVGYFTFGPPSYLGFGPPVDNTFHHNTLANVGAIAVGETANNEEHSNTILAECPPG